MVLNKTIAELFLSNSFHECNKWAHYLSIYEKYLSRFLGKRPVLLEVGVRKGGSLGIWKKYFGDESTIIGIDIDKKCLSLEDQGFEIFIGNQSDQNLLEKILAKHPVIDIVIDDGSHMPSDIIKTFECLYGKISHDGIYIIEDVSAALIDSKFFDSAGLTFSQYFQGIAKQINLGFADNSILGEVDAKIKNASAAPSEVTHSIFSRTAPPTDITATTSSIAFYPNMIVLEKSPQSIRTSLKTAGMRAGVNNGYRSYLLR